MVKKMCIVVVLGVHEGDVVCCGGRFIYDMVGWKASVVLWVCTSMLCTDLKTSMLDLET